MQLKETARIVKAMGAGRAAGQISNKARLERAKRDAARTADAFAREHGLAISAMKDLNSDLIQHVLSIHLDIKRQRFNKRHHDVDPVTLARIWFDTCETHPGTGWVMTDLEYERDRREGRSHQWKRHSWSGDVVPITGPQLELGIEEGAGS